MNAVDLIKSVLFIFCVMHADPAKFNLEIELLSKGIFKIISPPITFVLTKAPSISD